MMKYLVLPVALATVLAFAGHAVAACGHQHQSVEKPEEKPAENPSA